MKKYLALFLALVMLLLCTACGGTANNDDPPVEDESGSVDNTKTSDDAAEPITLGVTSLEYALADADAEPEGFICVVDRGDKYYWQVGVDDFDELREIYGLNADDTTYTYVYVAAENGEKYPYLYPELEGWKAYVYGITAWFTDDYMDGLTEAFNEWLQEVYSKFDFVTIRNATYDEYLANSPADDYEVTEEDIALFEAYTAHGVNRDQVYAVCVKELGKSVGYDAYQYLKTKVADKLRNKADVGTLLREMGITNTGGTQEGFGGGVAATYFDFDCDEWKAMEEGIETVRQMLARGLTYSNASDNMNRLHALDGGRILYEASTNSTSSNNAFAIVVGKDGTLYWRAGLDSCDTVRTVFDLTGEDYLDLQVYPVIDKEKAEYSLPDGLNPDVTRYFIYFEDDAVTWTVQTRNGAEFPDWFTSDMESAVMAAFEEWKPQVYSHFDRDAALAMFPDEFKNVGTYTDEDVALLKEYVTVLRDLEAQGLSMSGVLRESISPVVGSTMLAEVGDWINAKWRMVHTDCPLPGMKIGYIAYYGLASYNDPDDTLDTDILNVLTGSVFTDIEWTYTTEDGGYPFQAGLDLLNKGLVVYSDPKNVWHIASGEDCTVLFAISEEELLAN